MQNYHQYAVGKSNRRSNGEKLWAYSQNKSEKGTEESYSKPTGQTYENDGYRQNGVDTATGD